MAAIFSISCMLLVNWLVSVCVCARGGKVKSSIPLCSRSSHLCSPSQSSGADPWLNALEKPKVTQEKTRLESTEIGGKMRRIGSKGRRITLQKAVEPYPSCLVLHVVQETQESSASERYKIFCLFSSYCFI